MITRIVSNNFYKPAVKLNKQEESARKIDLNYTGSDLIALNFKGIVPDKPEVRCDSTANTQENVEKKEYTENEEEFIKFRDEISSQIEEVRIQNYIDRWNYYVDTSAVAPPVDPSNIDENILSRDLLRYNSLIKIYNKENLARLEKFKEKEIEEKINDPALKRHLAELLIDVKNNVTYKDGTIKILNKENDIQEKFNNRRIMMGGKKYSYQELNMLMIKAVSEKNIEMVKAAFAGLNLLGKALIDDTRDLIKMRNQYAKDKGYDNYYNMALKELYGIDEEKLSVTLNDLAEKTDKPAEKLNSIVKNIFVKEADDYVNSVKALYPITRSLFNTMGWDLDSMPIHYDIDFRENKDQSSAFCLNLKSPGDTRIFANFTENLENLRALTHETGHAVYNEGISSNLTYLDRKPPSTAINEGVAVLMESLLYKEKGFLKKEMGMPDDLLKKLDNGRKIFLLNSVRRYLVRINFEKEMYENPDQDMKELWNKLSDKYLKGINPIPITQDCNTLMNIVTSPAYMPNHLLGIMMAEQMYEALTKDGTSMTENPKIAEILKDKLFKYGASKTEDELMENLTGSSLKPDALLKQIENIDLD